MAIAFDAISSGSTTATSLTFSHTCTGSDRILFVGMTDDSGGSSLITGITYNGVALTKIGGVQTSGDRWSTLWYLIAPATGANNVVVTASSSSVLSGHAASYTGAKQTGQPDSNATNTISSSSSFSLTTTTVADNSWLVGEYRVPTGNTVSAGAGTVMRAGATSGTGFADSNSVTTPAGSDSLAFTISGSWNWGGVVASIAPSTSTAYTETFNETISLAENLEKQAGKSLDEAVTLADTMSRATEISLDDTITLLDTIEASLAYTRELGEILSLVDSGTQQINGKTLFEAITLADTLVRSVSISLAEALPLQDTIVNVKTYARELGEEIALSDNILKLVGKDISELVTLADTLSNQKNYNREFDETVTLVATIQNMAEKVLTDAITLVDTFSRVGTFGRDIDETINLELRFQGLINGQDISWFRKYSEQAGTFIKKYLDIP